MIEFDEPRQVKEWIGRSPDDPVPARVRLRQFVRDKGMCRACGREIGVGDKHVCDHTIAIVNGGENRERNLQTICDWCNRSVKTPADVAEKARTARVRAAHIGIKKTRRRWGCGRGDPYRKKLTGEIVPR